MRQITSARKSALENIIENPDLHASPPGIKQRCLAMYHKEDLLDHVLSFTWIAENPVADAKDQVLESLVKHGHRLLIPKFKMKNQVFVRKILVIRDLTYHVVIAIHYPCDLPVRDAPASTEHASKIDNL